MKLNKLLEFGLTGKIEINEKTRQITENKQTCFSRSLKKNLTWNLGVEIIFLEFLDKSRRQIDDFLGNMFAGHHLLYWLETRLKVEICKLATQQCCPFPVNFSVRKMSWVNMAVNLTWFSAASVLKNFSVWYFCGKNHETFAQQPVKKSVVLLIFGQNFILRNCNKAISQEIRNLFVTFILIDVFKVLLISFFF